MENNELVLCEAKLTTCMMNKDGYCVGLSDTCFKNKDGLIYPCPFYKKGELISGLDEIDSIITKELESDDE